MLKLNTLQLLIFILVCDNIINSFDFFYKREINAIGDFAIVIMNYISGRHNKTPLIIFVKTLMQDRIHFKKYSWGCWFNVACLLSIIYVGVTFYKSVDLDDFCEKMKSQTKDLEFLLGEDNTLQKMMQRQLGVNKKISNKKVVCWCCLELGIPLLRCGGCMKARYCGHKCQREDWCRHGDWCRERGGRWRERKMEKRRKKKMGGRTDTSCEVDWWLIDNHVFWWF